MRRLLLAFALAGCAEKAAPKSAPPPENPVCPTGMFPDGGRCEVIDPPCPPDRHLVSGRGCVRPEDETTAAPSATPPAAPSGMREVSPGVGVEDLVVGTGAEALPGRTLVVHYEGRLPGGAVFDTSRAPGRQPFMFVLGKGMLIAGWEEGLVGMRVGGRRRLEIAPEKGYGARGAPPKIPPGATLEFDVELLEARLANARHGRPARHPLTVSR